MKVRIEYNGLVIRCDTAAPTERIYVENAGSQDRGRACHPLWERVVAGYGSVMGSGCPASRVIRIGIGQPVKSGQSDRIGASRYQKVRGESLKADLLSVGSGFEPLAAHFRSCL